ncbi:MAG: DUF1844 domain-containing protein [Euryarchaeota archaeon]|jgi:hypothetical protein|nr:DUF1844 domain-containing protein [Euryarchaeota archaeon]MBT4982666.1 DUF1844 domain-containing protein [Euryarchaeota archaeon]MBT5185130.1 DUF1844 domain-containing protein [Euryarchaeota archaeon]
MVNEFFDDEGSTHLFQLVHMIQRSAMMHMGMLPDSEGRAHYNLGETKAAIDTLSMLKTKMTGNLNPKENTMLNGIISELQLQFVKAPARQRALEDQVAESEAVRETFTNPQEGPVEIITDEEE